MYFATLTSVMKLLQRVPLFYTRDFTQLLLHADNTEHFLSYNNEAR